jgi:LVIVD repeat
MTPRRTALTAAALVTPALIASMLLIPAPASADSEKPTFSFTGRYYNGGSEVSAILGKRMYVINGLGIDIVDISNPAAPTKLTTIDLSAYGGTITSVATSRRHVAVAVPKAGEGNAKGDPGTVVILDPEGTVLATALVGALPDMVTFDEDGKRVLVANEGEPVRYVANADGPVIDPVGSVSIISLKGLDKGDDRCEVEDDDTDDREDERDDTDDREDERDDTDDREDDRRPVASPAAQDLDEDREDGDRPQRATQDTETDEDDDRDDARGTRSRDDDDRKDDRRPAASPVATPPATATAVPVLPPTDDKGCDDDGNREGDDDSRERDNDGDDSRKDRPSTTPSAGTPTAATTPAVTAVLPATPVVLTATTVGFADFNAVGGTRQLDPAVRIFGPGATVAQDLEPEYITVAGDRAFVTLQENNAIAEIDIDEARVTAIRPLALKDHSLDGSGLDPSDRDLAPAFTAGTIAIAKWPVTGMPLPDGIDSFTVKGRTYLITANEGDARQDWPGYAEEVRVGSGSYVLDSTVFPNAAALKLNQALGRLTVSKASGDTDGDGDFDQIRSFGTRSVTIWGTDGTQVWDSGDQIEQQVKLATPSHFNSTNDAANSFDTRSDNKGPEPEGVVVGKVDGRMLAFVGLERQGGFMVFDVSDPAAPEFLQYATNRDFTIAPSPTNDSGPEVLRFVPAEDSPSGDPLVVVSNEISGTVAIWSAKD